MQLHPHAGRVDLVSTYLGEESAHPAGGTEDHHSQPFPPASHDTAAPGRQKRGNKQQASQQIGVLHRRRERLAGYFKIAEEFVRRTHQAGLERHEDPPVVRKQSGNAADPGHRRAGIAAGQPRIRCGDRDDANGAQPGHRLVRKIAPPGGPGHDAAEILVSCVPVRDSRAASRQPTAQTPPVPQKSGMVHTYTRPSSHGHSSTLSPSARRVQSRKSWTKSSAPGLLALAGPTVTRHEFFPARHRHRADGRGTDLHRCQTGKRDDTKARHRRTAGPAGPAPAGHQARTAGPAGPPRGRPPQRRQAVSGVPPTAYAGHRAGDYDR